MRSEKRQLENNLPFKQSGIGKVKDENPTRTKTL
jgi:hypothetical protein